MKFVSSREIGVNPRPVFQAAEKGDDSSHHLPGQAGSAAGGGGRRGPRGDGAPREARQGAGSRLADAKGCCSRRLPEHEPRGDRGRDKRSPERTRNAVSLERIVLDTNVLVSALLSARGASSHQALGRPEVIVLIREGKAALPVRSQGFLQGKVSVRGRAGVGVITGRRRDPGTVAWRPLCAARSQGRRCSRRCPHRGRIFAPDSGRSGPPASATPAHQRYLRKGWL